MHSYLIDSPYQLGYFVAQRRVTSKLAENVAIEQPGRLLPTGSFEFGQLGGPAVRHGNRFTLKIHRSRVPEPARDREGQQRRRPASGPRSASDGNR